MAFSNYLSWTVGKLAELSQPAPLARLAVRIFARATKIDLSEASRPINEYRSVAELFTRDLRAAARPIASGLVSPVDGTLRSGSQRSGQRIQNGKLEQIKGKDYSLNQFLANDALTIALADATYFNLYLAPHNYHHVHAPCDCSVISITHIPGRLLPVNNWSVQRVDGLFAQNERLVIELNTEFGQIVLVMVGATNVGKMSLVCDALVTNQTPWAAHRAVTVRKLSQPIALKAGARLGTFHLGSTVVLIVPDSSGSISVRARPVGEVRFGEGLLV